jgi:hypothetical protein
MKQQKWYVDAIDPLDGIVFASLREPIFELDIDTNEEELTSLEGRISQSLFISAPYFEPEKLGSFATALGATRAGLQSALFDEDGEIPFETIEDLVEFAKRSYRGSGGSTLPPDTTPLPSGPNPLPDTDLEGWLEITEEFQYFKTCVAKDNLKEANLTRLVEKFESSGKIAWSALSINASLDWPDEDQMEALLVWNASLFRSGATNNLKLRDGKFVIGTKAYRVPSELDMSHFPPFQFGKWVFYERDYQPLSVQELMHTLYRIPFPANEIPAVLSEETNQPPTLGGLLSVLCCDWKALSSNNFSARDFSYLLLAASAICALFENNSRHSRNYTNIMKSAEVWLQDNLAMTSLGERLDAVLAGLVRQSDSGDSPELTTTH